MGLIESLTLLLLLSLSTVLLPTRTLELTSNDDSSRPLRFDTYGRVDCGDLALALSQKMALAQSENIIGFFVLIEKLGVKEDGGGGQTPTADDDEKAAEALSVFNALNQIPYSELMFHGCSLGGRDTVLQRVVRLGFINTFQALMTRRVYGRAHLFHSMDQVMKENIVHLAVRSNSPKMLLYVGQILGVDIRRIIDDKNRDRKTPDDLALEHSEMRSMLRTIRTRYMYEELKALPPVPQTAAVSMANLKVLTVRDPNAPPEEPPRVKIETEKTPPPSPRPTEPHSPPRNEEAAKFFKDSVSGSHSTSTHQGVTPSTIFLCVIVGVGIFAMFFFFAYSLATSNSRTLKARRDERLLSRSDEGSSTYRSNE